MGRKGGDAMPAHKASSGLVHVNAKMHMAIPPVWALDPTASVLEQLDTLVMRYVPQLKGVLLTHSNVKFLGQMGHIDGDSAFFVAPTSFSSLVWRPQIGMVLRGTITLSSPSHVSLLLYDTFNAAISAPHLPASDWEFVSYTDVGEAQRRDAKDRSVGLWRHKQSGERLGGDDGSLAFTVISMTVANQMLSLHGSLLAEPFSVPPPRPGSLSFDQALGVLEEEKTDKDEEEEASVQQPRRVRWEDSDEEVEDDGEDGDEAVDDYAVDVAKRPEEQQEEDAMEAEDDADDHEMSMDAAVQEDEKAAKAHKKEKKDKKEKKEKKQKKEKKEKKKSKKSAKEAADDENDTSTASSGHKRARDDNASASRKKRSTS